MLQRALEHLRRNQALEASALLDKILTQQPDEPEALQLMGVVRRMQGRADQAEALYCRSLALKPDQSQVHHNLGNLYFSQNRFDEAIAAHREALKLKPNYVEAHVNLGLAHYHKGELLAAEKCYRQALRIQPNFLIAKQSLGAVLNDLERPKEAEIVLRQALAIGSRDPQQVAIVEHNLGVSVSKQHRHGEALALFSSAQSKIPDMPAVDYNRATALQGIGRYEEAVVFYQRALASNPRDLAVHGDLNELLYRLGRDDLFLRSYDDAAALQPEAGELPQAKGIYLFMRESFAEALIEFERASRIYPNDPIPHDALGLTHARLNNFEIAVREHEAALTLNAKDPQFWRNYAETLLRLGDFKKGLETVDRAIELDGQHQSALALRGTALALLADARENELNNYQDFIQVVELEPPRGYPDMRSFNDDLNVYLDRLHTSVREPVEQSLRGGTQTMDNLFGRGHDLVERLRERLDEAVTAFIARMKESPDHPFLRRRGSGFGYSASWSSRLNDCGFHANHFHPMGWISSAYYVALPDAIADEAGKQGWLKFGQPNFDAGITERRVVRPQIGSLVLFPSYMWHGTTPFRSEQKRTTIAFDVIPK